jgi:dCMP deaminase
MSKKISKEEYYLKIAQTVGIKSNCLMVGHGAIIVKDDQIISTGYVGSPRKTLDCAKLGYCIRRKKQVKSGTGYEICRSVHAEMNAIINAARAGVSLLGADMYLSASKRERDDFKLVNAYPCVLCKKMIINAGINRFIGNDEKGELKVYLVKDWVKDWETLENLENDKDQYFVDYNK